MTDFKYGKIKNKWILTGLIWAVLLYLSLVFYAAFFPEQGGSSRYILEMFINGLIALGVGYFLWHFKLWSAGDAKLFTLYAFLVPLQFYSNCYLNYFPSFILLVNTFLLILLFLAAEALFFNLRQLKSIRSLPWRKWFRLKELKPKIFSIASMYSNYLAFLIVLSLGMRMMGQSLSQKMGSNFALFFLILFIARRYLMRFVTKNKKVMSFLGLLTVGYVFYLMSTGQQALLFSILKMALIFMVTIGLLMKFLGSHIEKKEVGKTISLAFFLLGATIITIILKGSLLSLILNLFR